MKKTVILITVLLCSLAQGQFWENPNQKPSLFGMQINRLHLLSYGLVGCWLFNEGSGGQVYDLSGNGLTGTFISAVTWSPGKFGSALDFVGDADYISGAAPPGIVDTITYIAWVKSDLGSSADQTVLRVLDTALNIDNVPGLRWYPDIDMGPVTATYTFIAGIWYQVAVTQVGTAYVLYINGIQVGSGATNALDIVSGYGVNIGNFNAAGGLWDLDGQIDHVIIYNRVLSVSEVAQLYQEPFRMFEPSWDWNLYFGISVAAAAGQVIVINMD